MTIDEITHSAVTQILDEWNDWSAEGEQAATSAQDSYVWVNVMFAKLERVIKIAVEENTGTNYRIITDEPKLTAFVDSLPELLPHEVWYLCLFGRHKYDPAFPNTKDSGQLARVVARSKAEMIEKLRRLEAPIGRYTRDGAVASQEALAAYIGLNPRSLVKANQGLLIELATRFAAGQTDFNPVSLATQIHHAMDRKFYVDFDYDDADPRDYIAQIRTILPDQGMYRILKTRGGFHLIVELSKIRDLKTQWHPSLTKLPNCDVHRGSKGLIPIPGCVQGGFTPFFFEP